MTRLFIISLVIAVSCGIAFWLGLRSWESGGSKGEATLKRAPASLPPYGEVLSSIESQRLTLAEALGQTPESALIEARRLLQRAVTRDLPAHWLGTPWDFNGISEIPGEGKIACGYFVSTVLRDAGFEVERIRLAQQPSGNIIRTLTSRENTTRLVGKTFDEFQDTLRERGPGVYIIGLDRHVGIIAQTAEGAAFIHSDGGANQCVIVEPVASSSSLRRSRWREFANLSADPELLEKWLRGVEFPTVL